MREVDRLPSCFFRKKEASIFQRAILRRDAVLPNIKIAGHCGLAQLAARTLTSGKPSSMELPISKKPSLHGLK
jgi:hypothetical protein